ncbi:MAG: undecaprenyl-phosphate glucose phosphotransferase [Pseudomonadota bacterium]
MSTTARHRMESTSRRKRRGISREVCSDIVAWLHVTVITLAAAAATPFATLTTLPDGFLMATNAMVLTSAGFLTSLIYVEALRQGGYFRFDELLNAWQTTRGLIFRWALILLSFIAACYSLGLTQLLSRGWLLAWGVIASAGIIGLRYIVARTLTHLSTDGGLLCRRVAMIGTEQRTAVLSGSDQFANPSIEVVSRFETASLESGDTKEFSALKDLVEEGLVDDIVVCPQGDGEEGNLDGLLDQLRQLPINVSLAPHPLWVTRSGRLASVGGTPTHLVQRRPIDGWDIFTKMLEDRILAFVALLILSPIMLLCGLAVKLDSKGPILFVQRRQGMAGDIFPIIKFRSMRVMEDDDDVQQATRDDERITRVGRFLRATSLDELPQLFNVLKGDMSLVGPRPHALKHDAYYSTLIKDYAARHRVKPGMTGWAQVNGYRGETSEPGLMEARLRYDLDYIENWSLWFDLRILLLTVKVVLKRENAY